MKEYKCDICNKIFKYKNDYTRHTNRKNPCTLTIPNYTENIHKNTKIKVTNATNKSNNYVLTVLETRNVCAYCKKQFSQKSALNRHIRNNCNIKQQKDSEREDIFKRLLKEIEQIKEENKEIKKENKEIKEENKGIKEINNELRQEILKIRKTSNTIKHNTINSNNIQNIINNNNIKLVAYGKEDVSKLTDKEWNVIINKQYKSFEELIKCLHFDEKKPENHNIYIPNMRSKYLMVYDGNEWSLKDKKEKLDDLFEHKADIIFEKVDDDKDKLSSKIVDKFDKIRNEYDNDNEKIKAALLKDIELLLYNKRNIPIMTKKKVDDNIDVKLMIDMAHN